MIHGQGGATVAGVGMNSISVHIMCGHLDCGYKSYGPFVDNGEYYPCRACDLRIMEIAGDGGNECRIKWKEQEAK